MSVFHNNNWEQTSLPPLEAILNKFMLNRIKKMSRNQLFRQRNYTGWTAGKKKKDRFLWKFRVLLVGYKPLPKAITKCGKGIKGNSVI